MELWLIILLGALLLIVCVWTSGRPTELEIRKNIDYAIMFNKEYEREYWEEKLDKLRKGEKQNG